MEQIAAIVEIVFWEGVAGDGTILAFDRIATAKKFAQLINEDDGELADYTDNTSDSRAYRKGHWRNTHHAEVYELPEQVYSLPEAIDFIKGNWSTGTDSLEEEECPPYCSQGSLPIEEEPCEVCRRNEE